MTLRSGGEEINEQLEQKLNERLAMAGMEVVEARINYLAYAPEIAAVMLRRQQASAIITAREKIVEGAVSMVKMALHKLSEEEIVELDEDKKAAMVSNLLVVLCADEAAPDERDGRHRTVGSYTALAGQCIWGLCTRCEYCARAAHL